MRVGARDVLVAAAITAAAFFGLYALAYETHTGGLLDQRALQGYQAIRESAVTDAAHFFQSVCDPVPYVVICIVLLAFVLAGRGPLMASGVVVLLVGANVSTKLLKPLIASASGFHSATMVGAGSFPSGHSTAAMALACSVVIAAPAEIRPLAELTGGVFVLAVSWAEVVLGSHLPSDVIGGYLVGVFWALLVIAALCVAPARLQEAERRRIQGGVRPRGPSFVTATATIVTIGAVADILALIRLRPAAIRAAALIDFGTVAVSMTLLLALSVATVTALAGAPRLNAGLAGDRFGDR
jgi:membrane-associated phospholipid phosphatase